MAQAGSELFISTEIYWGGPRHGPPPFLLSPLKMFCSLQLFICLLVTLCGQDHACHSRGTCVTTSVEVREQLKYSVLSFLPLSLGVGIELRSQDLAASSCTFSTILPTLPKVYF